MKRLSKITLVIAALSAIWFGGVVIFGNAKISNFRSINEILAEANFRECSRAQLADCESAKQESEATYDQAIRAAWINVFVLATLPPVTVLLLSWFLFDRKKPR